MKQFGRRYFCATVGAGILGLAGALTACSSTDGNTVSAPSAPSVPVGAGGVLAGVTLDVRRDPG